MEIKLDQFIRENGEVLVDCIVKQAVKDLPEWQELPLLATIERVEHFLLVLADSIRQNNPNFLLTYLNSISKDRISEGTRIHTLHGFFDITEQQILNLIKKQEHSELMLKTFQGVIQNAMASSRLALSVAYLKNDKESE
jgi:hypothetical protein